MKAKVVQILLTDDDAKSIVTSLRYRRLAAKSRRDRLFPQIDPANAGVRAEALSAYSTATHVMVNFIESLKQAGFSGDWLEYDEGE